MSRSPSLRSVCRFPMRLFTHLRCSLHQREGVLLDPSSRARPPWVFSGYRHFGGRKSAMRSELPGTGVWRPKGGPAGSAKPKRSGSGSSNSLPKPQLGLLCARLPVAARGVWPRAYALRRPALKLRPVPTLRRALPGHARPLPLEASITARESKNPLGSPRSVLTASVKGS